MKITAPAGALARALAFVSRAAARLATTQPILASALFEADKELGVLAIGATDTELTARLSSSAPDIQEGGRAALPCRMFHDIVKALDAEATVHLEASDKQAALATQDGKNTYSLRLMAAENFPELAEFPDQDGSSFTLEAARLAEAIASVVPTASTDNTRPVLTGVLLAFGSDGATLVATDSYRMAVYSGKLEGAPTEGRAIIPAKALREVARLCSMGPERIEVAITQSAAMFRVGSSASGVMLATRLIVGQFPDHKKLMPAGAIFAKEYAADAGALAEALGRVGLFARGSSGPPAPITLSFSGDQQEATLEGTASARISAASDEVGSGAESVPVENFRESANESNGTKGTRDDGMEISMNPEYLIQAVKTCHGAGASENGGSGKVLFCLNDPLKPAVVRPEGESPVMVMIMPMRNPNDKEKVPASTQDKPKSADNDEPSAPPEEPADPEPEAEKVGVGVVGEANDQ